MFAPSSLRSLYDHSCDDDDDDDEAHGFGLALVKSSKRQPRLRRHHVDVTVETWFGGIEGRECPLPFSCNRFLSSIISFFRGFFYNLGVDIFYSWECPKSPRCSIPLCLHLIQPLHCTIDLCSLWEMWSATSANKCCTWGLSNPPWCGYVVANPLQVMKILSR